MFQNVSLIVHVHVIPDQLGFTFEAHFVGF